MAERVRFQSEIVKRMALFLVRLRAIVIFMNAWFVYLVRCADGSLYTGISTDVGNRLAQHNAKKGARYTRSRTPVVLAYREGPMPESQARKREAEIKGWTKAEKEAFLVSCDASFVTVSKTPPAAIRPRR